jgi:hypothetical protein
MLYLIIKKKDMTNTNTIIKQFLESNFPKQFIYFNNPKSIKIQLPDTISESLINFLQSQNIKFNSTQPESIQYRLQFIKNMTQIIINK